MYSIGLNPLGRDDRIRLSQSPFASSLQATSSDGPWNSSRSLSKDDDREEHPHLSWFQESVTGSDNAQFEGIRTTPLFSHDVANAVDNGQTQIDVTGIGASFFPQYGLLGLRQASYQGTTEFEESRSAGNLVYANTNAPWSTFICGSQGSGKSHTLSCLLENSLQRQTDISTLPNPLSGIIFHYDEFTGATSHQVCEAAYLSSSDIPVRVLVSPSNRFAMEAMYKNLPGLKASNLEVLPLHLSERQLNISNMIALMSVDQSSVSTPLYLEVVFRILRKMAEMSQGRPGVNYMEFIRLLNAEDFSPTQRTFLKLRLQLLESFMMPSKPFNSSDTKGSDLWDFPPGTLTIVDLSDPFVSSSDACALFNICLSLFLERRNLGSCVVALDEAHKFLTESKAASDFTNALTSIIAQQRHLATRVIIATQEPTISPRLLDLCNVTIVHRFLSPAWFSILRSHLAGAGLTKDNHMQIFETILRLEPGQALLFSPNAILNVSTPRPEDVDAKAGLIELGNTYIRVKIRKRVTVDGGRSILASDRMGEGLLSALRSNQASDKQTDNAREVRKFPLGPERGKPYPSPASMSARNSQSLPDRTRLNPRNSSAKDLGQPLQGISENKKAEIMLPGTIDEESLRLKGQLGACGQRIKQLNTEYTKLPGKKREKQLSIGLRHKNKKQKLMVFARLQAEEIKMEQLRREMNQIQDMKAHHQPGSNKAEAPGQTIMNQQTPVTLQPQVVIQTGLPTQQQPLSRPCQPLESRESPSPQLMQSIEQEATVPVLPPLEQIQEANILDQPRRTTRSGAAYGAL